jgi:Domain of unknown function (DUF4382)
MKSIRNELALAGLAVTLGIVTACSNSSNGMTQSGKGAVQFVMSASTAAPATTHDGSTDDHQLQAANVAFASILARNLDGQLINVTIELPVTVDVLGLVTGGAVTLPAGFLPPGTYDQLVIVMTKVELTLANGTVVTIDPPGGGWTSIVRVTDPFTVAEGQTTTVNLRFRQGGFQWLNDHWDFNPEFDCRGGNNDQGDDD